MLVNFSTVSTITGIILAVNPFALSILRPRAAWLLACPEGSQDRPWKPPLSFRLQPHLDQAADGLGTLEIRLFLLCYPGVNCGERILEHAKTAYGGFAGGHPAAPP